MRASVFWVLLQLCGAARKHQQTSVVGASHDAYATIESAGEIEIVGRSAEDGVVRGWARGS